MPLRSRAFRWLQGTGLFSNLGVWMVTLVSGFIMERLTRLPVLVTLASAMAPLAGILAVLFSGAAADSRTSGVRFLADGEDPPHRLDCVSRGDVVGKAVDAGDITCRPRWRIECVITLVVDDYRKPQCRRSSFPWRSASIASSGISARCSHPYSAVRSCAMRERPCSSPSAPPMFPQLGLDPGEGEFTCACPLGAPSRREPPRRGLLRMAVLLEHPGPACDCRPDGAFRDTGRGTRSVLPLFAAHYLHTSARLWAVPFAEWVGCIVGGARPAPASALSPPRRDRRRRPRRGARCGRTLVVWPTRIAAAPVLITAGACWVWSVVSFVIAARQVTPEWVQTRSLSLFYVVLQGPFVLGGLGFGVIDTFLPLRDTLLVAAVAFLPGILLVPRFRLPTLERSSLQLVGNPSLSIGEHIRPDDGPVLILVEYHLAGEDVMTSLPLWPICALCEDGLVVLAGVSSRT